MGALRFVFACCVWCVLRRGPSGPFKLLFLFEFFLQRYPSIKLLCNALVWLVGLTSMDDCCRIFDSLAGESVIVEVVDGVDGKAIQRWRKSNLLANINSRRTSSSAWRTFH